MVSLPDMLGRARPGLLRHLKQTRDPNFIGFDKYAKHGAYHWRELDHNGDYRGKAEFIRGYVQPESTVLDLGCGDGAYLYQLSAAAAHLVGIDADFSAVRLARKHLRKQAVKNVDVYQLPLSSVAIETLNMPRGFDVVYSMDVIEHLPQPAELLEAASRTMKDGGVAVIGTPLFIRRDLVSPYHVKEFTREEISGLISSQLAVDSEHIFSGRRSDGKTYEQAFYIAVAGKRA